MEHDVLIIGYGPVGLSPNERMRRRRRRWLLREAWREMKKIGRDVAVGILTALFKPPELLRQEAPGRFLRPHEFSQSAPCSHVGREPWRL